MPISTFPRAVVPDREYHLDCGGLNIAIHEWGHFLVDFEQERKKAGGSWDALQAEMKTIKISLKANPRNNALGFVFHKQGANLLKTKSDIEHDVRVLLGGMANEELFFGEDGTTNVAAYIVDGPLLYRIGGSSPAGDPTGHVLQLASDLINGE